MLRSCRDLYAQTVEQITGLARFRVCRFEIAEPLDGVDHGRRTSRWHSQNVPCRCPVIELAQINGVPTTGVRDESGTAHLPRQPVPEWDTLAGQFSKYRYESR